MFVNNRRVHFLNNIEGRVQFGKEYLVSVEFTLPTDTNGGSLYFQNLSEYFTVGKLVTYMHQVKALSDVPVLGSILDIYTQVEKSFL